MLCVSSIIADLCLIGLYGYHKHYLYCATTLAILILPALVVNPISRKWEACDNGTPFGRTLVGILHPGVLQRNWQVFLLCIKTCGTTDPEELRALERRKADLRILRLYKGFLSSAPQLVYQLYLYFDTDARKIITGVSALLSLLSLCWAIIDYDRASWQLHYKSERRLCFYLWLTLHEFGRMFVVLARVSAMFMMITAHDESAMWLFLLNYVLTVLVLLLLARDGAIPPLKSVPDALVCIPMIAAIVFSFIDVGNPSCWTLIAFVYAHSWYQSRESAEEFSQEGMKHNSTMHRYFSCGVLTAFIIGATCMWLCNHFCTKLRGHRFSFPNKWSVLEVEPSLNVQDELNERLAEEN